MTQEIIKYTHTEGAAITIDDMYVQLLNKGMYQMLIQHHHDKWNLNKYCIFRFKSKEAKIEINCTLDHVRDLRECFIDALRKINEVTYDR